TCYDFMGLQEIFGRDTKRINCLVFFFHVSKKVCNVMYVRVFMCLCFMYYVRVYECVY
ncbi:hypothetical protein BDC45DRAFT_517735, partial [Circinella umbellata]